MLHYAVVFFVISLIAAVFGFAGISGDAAGIARILFFVFLILATVSFIATTADSRERKPSRRELRRRELEREADARIKADALRKDRIAWLRCTFPLGKSFEYLGRTCVPTDHSKAVQRWGTTCPHDTWWEDVPHLWADYADDQGVIHSVQFRWPEAVALAASNELTCAGAAP